MADLAVKEFIPYTYEDILSDVKTRFYNKGYTDVENDGSNANKLSAILSGLLSNLAFNASANIQEMILSSAYDEINIIRGASLQGYERIKNISYQYEIQVEFLKDDTLPDTDTTPRNYMINKFDAFTSGAYNYFYMGDPIIRSLSNHDITTGSTGSTVKIIVKEGTLYKYSTVSYLVHTVGTVSTNGVLSAETNFELPLADIEEDGVEMYVTYSDGTNLYVDQKWSKSTSMLIENIDDKKAFIVLEQPTTSTYKLYWKHSNTGTDLSEGSIIKLNILTSNGANGVSSGSFTTVKSTYSVNTTYKVLKTMGVNKETKDEMAINAPKFNNTANRAISRKDYIAISNKRPEVSKVAVWGSEDEIPKYRKSAFLSYIPVYKNDSFVFNNIDLYTRLIDSSFYLSNSEIQSIFDYYKPYAIPSLKHESRQPLYIDFDFDCELVSYNPNKSVYTTNAEVFTTIRDYFFNNMEVFDSTYFTSNVISKINETVTDISGINLDVTTSIPIDSLNFDNLYGDDIHYRFVGNLSYAYKYPFDVDGNVVLNNLPTIEGVNFLGEGLDLVVDFSNEQLYNTYKTYDIKYNDLVCGRYIIVRDVEEYIRIELYALREGATPGYPDYINTPLVLENIIPTRLDLSYPNNNFSSLRNSIFRLKSLKFVL